MIRFIQLNRPFVKPRFSRIFTVKQFGRRNQDKLNGPIRLPIGVDLDDDYLPSLRFPLGTRLVENPRVCAWEAEPHGDLRRIIHSR